MKQTIFVIFSIYVSLLVGCSVQVKTASVPEFNKFKYIVSPNTRKDDVLIKIGSPQSSGIHQIENQNYELDYYYGLSGEGGLFKTAFESGTAFLTYKNDLLKHLLYFTTDVKNNTQETDIPIEKITSEIEIGTSSINKIYEILGVPEYTGERLQFDNNIHHKIAYYDDSDIPDDGAIKEKWLLIGYDNSDTIQDIIWVSSYSEDIKHFGDITPQKLMQISRMDQADWGISYAKPESFSTNTKIDPVRVEALLRSSPSKIDEITSVLGKPTAYGIKSLKGEAPVILANYSHMSLEISGREERYISPAADDETRKKHLTNQQIYILDAKQTLLMIGHTPNGDIKEIIWMRPSPE